MATCEDIPQVRQSAQVRQLARSHSPTWQSRIATSPSGSGLALAPVRCWPGSMPREYGQTTFGALPIVKNTPSRIWQCSQSVFESRQRTRAVVEKYSVALIIGSHRLELCDEAPQLCSAWARVHLGHPAVRQGKLSPWWQTQVEPVGVEVLLPGERPASACKRLDVAHLHPAKLYLVADDLKAAPIKSDGLDISEGAPQE
jgi:hypothetical protein